MKRNFGDIESALAEQAREYLQELETTVDDVETDVLNLTDPAEADESLLRISRNAHSIKGTAGSFGYDLISTICHSLEDRVSGIRADSESLGVHIDGLLRYLDLIRSAGRAYQANDKAALDTIKRSLGVSHAHSASPAAPTQAPAQSASHALKSASQRHRILLVEKMGPVLKMASNVLNQFDPASTEIAIAGNGYEAFGRLLRERFDCVVMSNTTDLVNGTELIKLLEDCNNPNSSTPFVLLTSDHRLKAPEIERRIFLIMKGADLKQRLRDVCQEIFGASATAPAASKFSVHDILLVDDSPPIQRLVQMVLKNVAKLDVRVAGSGAEAMAQLASRLPDIALLDYQLPDTDGVELAKKIKAQYPQLRFLFLTGAESDEELARLESVAPAGIIKKPFPPMHLIARLKEHASFAASA